ncbi:MAG: PEP-CTERM sorting domain-containing protein [Terriglobales bacterium]
MTPLERAKAFVQSRAATTALKILPLALAAVVSANADTAKLTLSGDPQWLAQTSSTGAYLVLTNSVSSGMQVGNGVTGFGSTDMEVVGNSGTTAPASFFMSGGGTGTYQNPITVSWDFTVNCDAQCKAGEQLGEQWFQYQVVVFINGNEYDSDVFIFLADPNGSLIINDPTLLGQQVGPWSAQVNLVWANAVINETGNWGQTYLTIDPGGVVTPEPASMLLLFTGLPFVVRLTRKK